MEISNVNENTAPGCRSGPIGRRRTFDDPGMPQLRRGNTIPATEHPGQPPVRARQKTAVPPVERGGKSFQSIIYHYSGQNTSGKKKNHPRLGMSSFRLRVPRAGSPRPLRRDFRRSRTRRKRPGICRTKSFSAGKPPRSRKKLVSAVDY